MMVDIKEMVKFRDHDYHRSRVDAHITGSVLFVALMAILGLTIGDKFRPFHYGASWLEPARLIWVEQDQGWTTEAKLVELGTYPPAGNQGPVVTADIYPIVLSVVVTLGSIAIAYFIYAAARRQTRLMLAVYADAPDRPYQRPWSEIRVTFWALDLLLLFILFFFMM